MKKKDKDKDKWKGKSDVNRNETHIVEDEVTFVGEEPMEDDAAFTGRELMEDEVHNFDSYDACNVNAINDHLIYYDWLANNMTVQWETAHTHWSLGEIHCKIDSWQSILSMICQQCEAIHYHQMY
jgi:hypothetical protein